MMDWLFVPGSEMKKPHPSQLQSRRIGNAAIG
jgi:hypothetical protein